MQPEYVERPTHDELDREILLDESSLSISHFTHVLQSYRHAILFWLGAAALAIMILVLALYLFSPAEQVTSQTFRLDFEGAGDGEYPNHTKFNIADIISGPIITKVWRDNRLENYITFPDFSRAVFVLESNREYEQLASAYSAKLADPKLSPIDRERLQKEFEMKTESIAKNEYSINLDRRAGKHPMPEALARKVLLDIMNRWAEFAVNQQHVIAYQVSVLSPEILKPSAMEQNDVVAAIEILRAKALRVTSNIEMIERLPGASLARGTDDQVSLQEVRIRVEDIVRFQLDPLLASVLHSNELISDRAATLRFLESQLAYDQRELEATQRVADSIRDAIAVYEQRMETVAFGSQPSKPAEQNKSGESVMPQISDSFIDRLLSLTSRAADVKYRQNAVDDYRRAVAHTVPLKQAVAYDAAVLEEFRKSGGGGASLTRAGVNAEILRSRTDLAQLITRMNDLFQIVSTNMTPSTQLFTLTGTPATRTLRSLSARRLTLYGTLLFLLSIPAVIIFCLLHDRVREQEIAEDHVRHDRTLAHSEGVR